MARYFYDSYSVLAYLSDRPNYRSYFEENVGVLTKVNLMEIHYKLLAMHGPRAAKRAIYAFSKYVVEFGLRDIEDSMKLRLKMKSRGLDVSYADALGYHLATKMKVKFLTGDNVFKGLANVEYQA